eukprot:gb/GECH01013318.1/.p1 GENE.gb/GECH01013318.1/~~gb/GECH01013318.1/.p1  ORF type:complete len:738 (+),score=195.78 gb/GECH01013318.1/:1-2214(+)
MYSTLSSERGATSTTRPMSSRPPTMGSVRAAGYTSVPKTAKFDPLNQGKKRSSYFQQEEAEQTPEQIANKMEKKVNHLIESSAQFNQEGKYTEALEKAEAATQKEASLSKYLEESGMRDQINADLKYATAFNLAVQYEATEHYTKALNAYSSIVKNRYYSNAGRLRVNMGNIYFAQNKFNEARRMYKMALDGIPNHNKETRFKIMKNFAHALVHMGSYSEASQLYEAIMEEMPDSDSGFNLILCYYALGEKDKMKKGFVKLLSVQIETDEESDNGDDVGNDPETDSNGDLDRNFVPRFDDKLKKEQREKRERTNEIILKAGRLISGIIEKDWESGFDYVIDQLKYYEVKYPNVQLSSEMEMTKALNYLKNKQFDKAIKALTSFEKKDPNYKAKIATNISYLYILQGKLDKCEKYASLAVESDNYNARALVNLGNANFSKKNYSKAKELYEEAVDVEPDCVEALYNYGLVCRILEDYDLSIQAFRKLLSYVPKSVEVTYQIAFLNEIIGDDDQATEWYSRVATLVPTDPGILAKLGDIYSKEDESQAVHYHLESYRLYPVDIEVISKLGAYYVNNEIYEQALVYFERASHIQPNEPKWQLLMASCHRKTGNYQQAKELYEQIHRKNPENVECIRYLYRICNYLGQTEDVRYYHKQVNKLESNPESNTREDSAKSHATLDSTESQSDNESKVSFVPPEEKTLANSTPDTRPPSNKAEPASDTNESEEEESDIGDDLLPM